MMKKVEPPQIAKTQFDYCNSCSMEQMERSKYKKNILIFFIDLKKKKNSMVPNSAGIKVQQSTAV